MDVEEKLRSKYLYKVLLITLKYIPLVITGFYILNTTLNILEIDAPVISNLAGVSLLTWIFLLLSNIVFKFCICHRVFLYYILAVDLFNITDYYIGIPLYKHEYIAIHSVLLGVALFLFVYYHVKNNKKPVVEGGK